MANENKMNIIEALKQLRDDLKQWVANNLRVKADKTYVEEMIAETKAESSNKDAVVLSEAQKAISTKADKYVISDFIEYDNMQKKLYPGLFFTVTKDLYLTEGLYKVVNSGTTAEKITDNTKQYNYEMFAFTSDLIKKNDDGTSETIIEAGLYMTDSSNLDITRKLVDLTVSSPEEYIMNVEQPIIDEQRENYIGDIIHITQDVTDSFNQIVHGGYYIVSNALTLDSIDTYDWLQEGVSFNIGNGGLTVNDENEDTIRIIESGCYLVTNDWVVEKYDTTNGVDSVSGYADFVKNSTPDTIFYANINLDIKSGFYIVELDGSTITQVKTSIPVEYITETELADKNFVTQEYVDSSIENALANVARAEDTSF